MAVQPTPDTLSFYVVYMSHHIEPKSVQSYLSGICNQLEPYFPEVRTVRNAPVVRKALAGCIRLYQSPTKRKLPISREQLLTICATLDNSPHHNDMLFISLLLCGFYGLHRLGELTARSSSDNGYRKIIKVMSVKITTKYFEYILPFNKADHLFEGNRIIIQKIQHSTDPYKRFITYFRSRHNLFPLRRELWLTSEGKPPTRDFFLTKLHTFLSSDYGGHSLRAGGATCLAEMGTPPYIIQATGCWNSDTFQRYIRKNPTLMHALTFSAIDN